MMHKLTTEERAQKILEWKETRWDPTTAPILPGDEDAEKFEERLPNVPTRDITGKRTETTLDHKCWFFRDEKYNSLTVRECLSKFPEKIEWAYENLNINWSECVVDYSPGETRWTKEGAQAKKELEDRLLMMGYRLTNY